MSSNNIISNFLTDSYNNDFALGAEAKSFIALNNHIQINNINENSIKKAVVELIKYIENEDIDLDIDYFSKANILIFNKQEKYYLKKSAYKTLSLLAIAFLQLGIISFE